MVDAVNRLGAGDFLKNLGDFRQALFHGLDGVSVVLQVGQRFGNNGSPEVFIGVAQLVYFRGHSGILKLKVLETKDPGDGQRMRQCFLGGVPLEHPPPEGDLFLLITECGIRQRPIYYCGPDGIRRLGVEEQVAGPFHFPPSFPPQRESRALIMRRHGHGNKYSAG